MRVAEILDNINIKITSSGQRDLGDVIISELYKKVHIEEKVSKWREELLLLSKIAEIKPQSAYSAYIHIFKSKYNLFNCTAPTMKNHMKILEDVLRNHFIPGITSKSSISELLIRLVALTVIISHLKTEAEYNA